MSSRSTSFADLVLLYSLNEDKYNRKISDKHFDEVSRSHCSRWRSLRARLEMKNIVVDDIDRAPGADEDEKRLSFFSKWKQKRGSKATYKCLISALLEIECVEDAEGVCKMLKNSPIADLCDDTQSPASVPAIATPGKFKF